MKTNRVIIPVAIAVVAIAIIWFINFGPWSPMGHWFWRVFRDIWVPVTLIVGVPVVLWFIYDMKDLYSKDILFVVIGTVSVIAGIGFSIVMPYMSSHAIYKASGVEIVENADTLSYADRAPYEVASIVSDKTMGDTTGNSTGIVKIIVKDEIWTTSMKKREWFSGYESVQTMDLPMYGSPKSNAVTFCNYSDNANKRLGGIWGINSLNTVLYNKVGFNTTFNHNDAFAVCEDGTPMLYIPLLRLEGFFVTHYVPAGVAVYNGETGILTIENNLEMEYPIYSQYLASKQRESLATEDGFWAYIMGYAGYETSDNEYGNRTEISLKNENTNNAEYTTFLTPRGSSTSVVAISAIGQEKVENGVYNPITVHTYGTTRPALSTVSQDIISDVLEGYKASGLYIFEIVPSENGTWVASIGNSQSILYRAEIVENGTITLYNKNGEKINSINPTGDIDDENVNIPSGEPLDVEIGNSNLSEMDKDELEQYAEMLLNELANVHSEMGNRIE